MSTPSDRLSVFRSSIRFICPTFAKSLLPNCFAYPCKCDRTGEPKEGSRGELICFWRDLVFVQKETPYRYILANTPFSVSLLLVFMTHQAINQTAANLHQISQACCTRSGRLDAVWFCCYNTLSVIKS